MRTNNNGWCQIIRRRIRNTLWSGCRSCMDCTGNMAYVTFMGGLTYITFIGGKACATFMGCLACQIGMIGLDYMAYIGIRGS